MKLNWLNLFLMGCLCSLPAFAASGDGKRKTGWQRMPIKIKIISSSGEPIQIDAQIENLDGAFKFCDAVVSLRSKSKVHRQWIRGWKAEVDQSVKFKLSFPELQTEHLDAGSFILGASCLEIGQDEDITLLKPSEKCQPLSEDCDQVCVADDSSFDRCQATRKEINLIGLQTSNLSGRIKLQYTLDNSSKKALLCGGISATPAGKDGTTTEIVARKVIPNQFLQPQKNQLEVELNKNMAGMGYILNTKASKLYLSCIDAERMSLWDIGAMAKPDLHLELNWMNAIPE